MNKPFLEAANAVIKMYAWRQESLSLKCPPHSLQEIHLVCKSLNDIALSAAYAASVDESAEIFRLTCDWPRGSVPAFFPIEDVEVSQ
jgi:hypothetical protein